MRSLKGERWLPGEGGEGAPGRNRTCDPRFRKPVLYPTELRVRGRIVNAVATLRKPSLNVNETFAP